MEGENDELASHRIPVSRRSVLRKGALAAGTVSVVGTLSTGARADTVQEGETFLEAIAGDAPLLVGRGDVITREASPELRTRLLPEAVIGGPEGILVFSPQRLATGGEVGPESVLVMGSARAMEGDLTAAISGGLVSGNEWFPERSWIPSTNWFPRELFVSEAGLDDTLVVGFRDENTEPGGDTFVVPAGWSDWRPEFEPAEVVEPGASLEELAAERLVLLAAIGSFFFADDDLVGEFSAEWEALAEAEATTVLDPDELRS